jgi:hypothetical protein
MWFHRLLQLTAATIKNLGTATPATPTDLTMSPDEHT